MNGFGNCFRIMVRVGVDEETIKNYVELQGRQDLGQLQLKL
jgi:hypothetical protein